MQKQFMKGIQENENNVFDSIDNNDHRNEHTEWMRIVEGFNPG